MSEIELMDAVLRLALELQRLSASEEAEADAILRELQRDLQMLLQSRTLSEAGKREIEALAREAESAINARYATVAGTLDTHGLVVLVSERTVEAMQGLGAIKTLTPEVLASLSKNVLIDGAPSSAWWERQAEDTAFKFAGAVRQGVINGETNERIVQRIVGKGAEPGVLNVARRNARALVHSSIMSASTDARLAVFRKNVGIIAGVRWLSTLDSHTCVQCAALDGAAWDLDGGKLKGTAIDFMSPPAHWSCRCVLSPIPKSFADLGLNIPEPTEEGQRASSEGPVSATTTFADFLHRNPSVAEKVLGKRRVELFEAGKLTLSDLVSGTGREMTLAELR